MEHIRETLAKNQPAPSQTSRGECAICGKIGATYRYQIYAEKNITQMLRCSDCMEKEDAEREKNKLLKIESDKAEAEVKLKEVISSQETQWQLEDSHMPPKFVDKTFGNFDSKLQPKAFDVIKNLQWEWNDVDDIPPKSLVLLSPGVYGVGKTHLVCALMNLIIKTAVKATMGKDLYIRKRQCPVYFISENELLRRIRDTYNRSNKQNGWGDEVNRETEEAVYASLKRVSLLVIDDVGKVKPRDLNFLQGVYFNIIDQRYNDSQPIILTTNLDLDELEEHIGGACADRLREMAGKNGIVKMSGKSYRQQ